MAYGAILGQTPIIPENPKTIATNVTYNNSQTSSIITGTNVQQAIDQLFTSVSNGKQQIASAITDKGVSTSGTDSFATMSENIGKIETVEYEVFSGEVTIQSEVIDSYEASGVRFLISSMSDLKTGDSCFLYVDSKYLYCEVYSISDVVGLRVCNLLGYRKTFIKGEIYNIIKVNLSFLPS